jgi:DNA-binding protein H-NS
MKSYSSIKAQIAQLEREAEDARKTEVADVVARIRKDIAAYGLTAADLGLKLGRGGKPGRKIAGAGVPKYQDPKSGKTWTGRGKPPAWIAKVSNRDAFLIDKAGATSSSKPKKSKAAGKTVSLKSATKPKAGRAGRTKTIKRLAAKGAPAESGA